MTRYGQGGIKMGLVLLVLVVGWTYRFELMEWFVPATAIHDEGGHREHPQGEDGMAYWTCPMHPSVQAQEAGPCPLCGMDLQPVPAPPMVAEDTGTPPSQPAIGGANFITLSPWQRQLIGVTTAPVERRSAPTTVRAVGRIDYDETRLVDVHLKTRGWIEKLYVDYTGEPVKEGQPLLAFYSPEVSATQEEYLLTLRTLRDMESGYRAVGAAEIGERGGDPIERDAIVRQRSLLEAARQRLQLWDVNAAQIRALREDGKAPRTVTIHAPAAGIVLDKMAMEGMYVTLGTKLYRIAALDTVWVYAEVYENELSLVRVGQGATVELPYLPGQSFRGQVEYVYPYLDAQTRTTRVRLRVANPEGLLRPDMYADVILETEAVEQLAVPGNAVLFSGQRRVVFVDRGRGRFQPREVRLGARLGDHYHVLAGLATGEQVVTSAPFLLDSESKLKDVMAGLVTQYE